MPRKILKTTKHESEEKYESPEESPEETESSSSPVKKEKAKRAPSAYNLFVKEHIGQFSNLPPKERMSAVSELWKASKSKNK